MKPDYGIDAPGLVRMFFGISAVCFGVLGLLFEFLSGVWLWLPALLAGLVAAYTLFMGCYMIRGSRVDKIRERDMVLAMLAWNGTEQVLDVGCGRGLMLVGAAQYLTTGKATGIDIWSGRDQSDNSAAAALANADIAGVAVKVAVQTADMRDIPFADNSFDVVMSSWVVHNLDALADRTKALGEMVRVLKPGGTLLLTDIANRDEYRTSLRALPVEDVRLIVLSPATDRFRSLVSFGSFQPATIMAAKSGAA